MFTLEESALLGRMLRVVGWGLLCLTLAGAGCAVLRWVDHPRITARGKLPAHVPARRS